ncbi:6-bladed beta-propeller [Halosquirtibacter xylanolyticus]|uniref:6-bladed beta-propeller n=1 Tax=Halosquirtibacter xylanolyticus TaxID=3374599 RepID=UPI0037489FA6|nr:6-bladed beta-propeller [Prolixibacteraceae bacterium]
MYSKSVLTYLLLILFVACKSTPQKKTRLPDGTEVLGVVDAEVEKVDLNPFLKKSEYDLSSYIKEAKLIPLETTEASLLGRISDVIMTSTHIYIRDNSKGHGIFIFDNKGKYITQIKKGQGPGELLRVSDMAFDNSNQELLVSQRNLMSYYSPNGKFVRNSKIPFYFAEFDITKDGYIFYKHDSQSDPSLGESDSYNIIITNKQCKIKQVGMPSTYKKCRFYTKSYMQENGYLSHRFSDTIFQYRHLDNMLYSKYILDFSSKKVSDNLLAKLSPRDLMKQDDYYFLGDFLETSKHSFFSLLSHRKKLYLFRDKKTKKVIGGTKVMRNNLFPRAGVAYRPMFASGDYFITIYTLPHPKFRESFVDHSTIFSEEDKLIAKSMKMEENPALILYTLKEF